MCGIIGILGRSDVTERLVDGLSRLEYRGYDSAGLALIDAEDRVSVRRAVGKLDALRTLLVESPTAGRLGIGHTRWATHGAATVDNAHPHRAGRVTLVHNGIIENYNELRLELEAKGTSFSSQTDTEVAARYLEHLLPNCETPEAAFSELLNRIVGSYALVVIFEGRPDVMFAARQGSPLAIGYGQADDAGHAEMFVGSDALALAPFTEQVSYLEDGDWAVVRSDQVRIFDRAGAEVMREIATVSAATWSVDKGPYRHFMLKEIHDQPDTLARLTHSLLDTHNMALRPFLTELDFADIDKVTLVACGTAHYACHIAKYLFEALAGLPVEIDLASEYRYRTRVHQPREFFIAVSQSGETADTLAALKNVAGLGAGRLAVVNVATSSIAREAEHVLDIEAGPEIGVASTKAFTGQLLALLGLVLKAGHERKHLTDAGLCSLVEEMTGMARVVAETLMGEAAIGTVARSVAPARAAFFLGRGVNYPLALEAALKLKEISYIYGEGYAAGELKHGPIALIERDTPVIVFDSRGHLQEKTRSNAAEVSARDARVWTVGPGPEADIRVPVAGEIATIFAYAAVAQLLAYRVAVERGTDVDQPRNLAKSVTVE